jgi:iron complex transport system substrate-binding protein
MKKKITILLCLIIMTAILTACAGGIPEPNTIIATEPAAAATQSAVNPTPPPAALPVELPVTPPAEAEAEPRPRPEADREGYPITLPETINTILSIGPSITEVLVALGAADRIIGIDMFSEDVEGLPEGISARLSIVGLDAEYIVSLMPDLVFISGMTRLSGYDDPLAPVSAAGITVIYMPSSTSVTAIMEDIRFMAAVLDEQETGEAIISDMQAEIDEITEIAANIQTSRTVYFELSAAPWMVSFGRGTFLNEMIELLGAENIFTDAESWISVSDETLIDLNPDVILTSTDWLDDPIGEIKQRPGFSAITAVQNGDIFRICTASSNRPNHNIVRALREMAVAVFPEYFG